MPSVLPCMLSINDLRGSEVAGRTDGMHRAVAPFILLIIPRMHGAEELRADADEHVFLHHQGASCPDGTVISA